MFRRARVLFQTHPIWRDALLWAIPALLFGALLRGLLLSYQPYAYWGSDSNSYYSFAHMLLGRGLISLDEKRRLLYPLLMVPISLLPGEPLRSVAWVQHALGLFTVFPFAYIVRKLFRNWRVLIVPLSCIYAGIPMFIWYEHELIGESLFFAALVWACAGWVAWVHELRLERSRRIFWCFYAALGVFFLTKPSGRFVWPGVCFGLLCVGAWRTLERRHWIALLALFIATLSIGSRKQGAWLFYSAAFPLTRLDTPLLAEYKAEIRDLLEPLQDDLGVYYMRDEEAFDFLERPGAHPDRPHWYALARDAKKRTRVYTTLALEGVKARPDLFLLLALQRILVSANPSLFKEDRFAADYFARRFKYHYEEAVSAVAHGKPTAIPMLFDLDRSQPFPPYAEFRKRLAPVPDAPAARWMLAWARRFETVADLIRWPAERSLNDRRISRARPAILGWWICAGAMLSFLPRFRKTVGVWTVIAIGYVIGVFLVSLESPRYFAPALPFLCLLLAVPAELIIDLFRFRSRPHLVNCL